MNLFVGHLSSKTSKYQVRMAFERYGQVDRISRNEQGGEGVEFSSCIVEMPFDKQANDAIKGLNGKKLGNSILNVKESRINI